MMKITQRRKMRCLVDDELQMMWKEAICPNLRCYSGIYLEQLRRTVKISVKTVGLPAET
jgi:hypothetical protein